MRHGKKINHLGRKSEHRKAMLSNMAASLILSKRITTTVAKAKALKKYVEPLITKAKNDTTHSRRNVFSYLGHKEPVKELFSVVADKIAERPGGYTRILKTGNRMGDNAEMCIIELVDFNETYTVKKEDKKDQKKRTRRGGSSGAKKPSEEEVTEVHEQTTEPKPKTKTKKAEKTSGVIQVEEVKEEVVSETHVEEIKAETVTESPLEEVKGEAIPEASETPSEEEKPAAEAKE